MPMVETGEGRVFTICKCLWLFAWLDNNTLHFDTVARRTSYNGESTLESLWLASYTIAILSAE